MSACDKRKKKQQRVRKVTCSEIERSTLAKRRNSMWESGSTGVGSDTVNTNMSRSEGGIRRLSVHDRKGTTIHRKKRSLETNASRRKSVLDGSSISRRKSIIDSNNLRRKSIYESGSAASDSRRKSVYNIDEEPTPSLTRRKSLYQESEESSTPAFSSRRRDAAIDLENPSLTRRRTYNVDSDAQGLNRRKSTYPGEDSRRKSMFPGMSEAAAEGASLTPRRRELNTEMNMPSLRRRGGDVDEAGSVTRRRRLSNFCPEPSDESEFDTDDEERELYRKTFLEEAESGESGKTKNKVEYRNRVTQTIAFLALEHELLLQVLMVLPLTLMALYIVLIEGGPIVRVHENGSWVSWI